MSSIHLRKADLVQDIHWSWPELHRVSFIKQRQAVISRCVFLFQTPGSHLWYHFRKCSQVAGSTDITFRFFFCLSCTYCTNLRTDSICQSRVTPDFGWPLFSLRISEHCRKCQNSRNTTKWLRWYIHGRCQTPLIAIASERHSVEGAHPRLREQRCCYRDAKTKSRATGASGGRNRWPQTLSAGGSTWAQGIVINLGTVAIYDTMWTASPYQCEWWCEVDR